MALKEFDFSAIKKIIKDGFHVLEEDGIKARILNSDNPEEVKLYQRLRYHFWIEKFKYIKAPKRDHKLERDDYDEHSVHFGAFNIRQDLIGYSRFILPGPHGLQVQREFEELVHPRVKVPVDMAQCVESSRLIVIPELGPKRHQAAQMIYKLKYQFMKRFGFKYWYHVSEAKLIRALRLQRYPFEIIGEGKEYQGATCYPAVMSIDKVDEILLKEKPEYYAWLNAELEGYSQDQQAWYTPGPGDT